MRSNKKIYYLLHETNLDYNFDNYCHISLCLFVHANWDQNGVLNWPFEIAFGLRRAQQVTSAHRKARDRLALHWNAPPAPAPAVRKCAAFRNAAG